MSWRLSNNKLEVNVNLIAVYNVAEFLSVMWYHASTVNPKASSSKLRNVNFLVQS